MADPVWVVPKALKRVKMWIRPEGEVLAGIYLVAEHPGEVDTELPVNLLNTPQPFFACQCGDEGDLRFYNKDVLSWMQYEAGAEEQQPYNVALQGEFGLEDGTVIAGSIREMLPPAQRRLLDYLNIRMERFIRVFMEDGMVILLNKAHIVRVVPMD